jgi:hypothetical protein
VVAPPRPAREHRTAALANRALPRATCPCLDGAYLRASRAAAIETPDEALTLVHSTYPLMFPIGVNEPTRWEMSMR